MSRGNRKNQNFTTNGSNVLLYNFMKIEEVEFTMSYGGS